MKRAAPWIITGLGLAVMAALMGWALYASETLSGGWEELRPVAPIIVVGVLVVGGLTGGLIWLAFYSDRHGYDKPFDPDAED